MSLAQIEIFKYVSSSCFFNSYPFRHNGCAECRMLKQTDTPSIFAEPFIAANSSSQQSGCFDAESRASTASEINELKTGYDSEGFQVKMQALKTKCWTWLVMNDSLSPLFISVVCSPEFRFSSVLYQNEDSLIKPSFYGESLYWLIRGDVSLRTLLARLLR